MVRSSASVGTPSVIGANVGALTDCLHTHTECAWDGSSGLSSPCLNQVLVNSVSCYAKNL
ncbi:hypothetical protein AA0116_g1945 [Alternaria tenuissima]|nr:hypothetical protein AA0116_g1945 [Alternaria tenuissima]